MNRQYWNSFGLLLLGLSLVAASSVPPETPPAFLNKWGTKGTGDGQFNHPFGVAVDATGQVYVADTTSHRIQKFDGDGTFLAKWGMYGSSDGQFDWPIDVAVDATGNVYVADSGNHRIQKFDSNGTFLIKWGSNGTGVAVDASSNVYVAERVFDRIQKYDSTGHFLIKWGYEGSAEGYFHAPDDVVVDASGNVYVADSGNNRIQKFDSNGTFLRMWGWGVQDESSTFQTCTSGCQSGLRGPGDGQFFSPLGLAVDASGNVYVADTFRHRIQKFDSSGTFLAKWGSFGNGDGQFISPRGVAVDAAGNVYVVDTHNNRIQKFASAGAFLVMWGWGVKDGSNRFQVCTSGCQAGRQPRGDGELTLPRGVVVDASNNVYIPDTNNLPVVPSLILQ